jgi:predicted Zn-dependent protease
MTSGMLQQAGGIAVGLSTSNKDPKTRQIWNTAFGVGSTLGVLAFSRTHETEADKLGMVFMTMAGYKPEEAINLWIRMSQQSKGNKPPEFLSTHPSDQTRIKTLRDYLPTAKALAKKYNTQQLSSHQ